MKDSLFVKPAKTIFTNIKKKSLKKLKLTIENKQNQKQNSNENISNEDISKTNEQNSNKPIQQNKDNSTKTIPNEPNQQHKEDNSQTILNENISNNSTNSNQQNQQNKEDNSNENVSNKGNSTNSNENTSTKTNENTSKTNEKIKQGLKEIVIALINDKKVPLSAIQVINENKGSKKEFISESIQSFHKDNKKLFTIAFGLFKNYYFHFNNYFNKNI